MDFLFGMIIFIILFCLYFLPTIVAQKRDRPNQNSVLVINLFLGWTLLGWVIALAMAVSGKNVET
jgi:RsiW-degrading membrane proteinase PrsW (M82 family)